MLFLVLPALAERLRDPERITIHAEGAPLEITRMEAEVEVEEDPEAPTGMSDGAYEAYERAIDNLADHRDDLKAVDALLRRESGAIARCAADAGAAAGAKATAHIRYARDGTGSVKAASGGDPALSGCLVSLLHKQQRPVLLHEAPRNPEGDWSFTLVSAPETVPSLIDRTTGFGPVEFGETYDALDERRLSMQHRNSTTYTRGFDADAILAGAKGGPAWSFDATQGLYAVRLQVSSDSAAFAVKESLKAMFGVPRWDTEVKGLYWRGEHILWVTEQAGDATMVTVLDIDRARAAGLLSYVPGDARDITNETGSRLPRILGDGN
ncbi:MAG: hypothetical protein FJ102_20410 [Deltaproteobacteria bacterium]|nr:hypothetical protein [Deltaproteobacteria bacterium]